MKIARRAEAYEHVVIGLHACFRWRGSLIEGFSFKDIEILLPDLLINVVDKYHRYIRTDERECAMVRYG